MANNLPTMTDAELATTYRAAQSSGDADTIRAIREETCRRIDADTRPTLTVNISDDGVDYVRSDEAVSLAAAARGIGGRRNVLWFAAAATRAVDQFTPAAIAAALVGA